MIDFEDLEGARRWVAAQLESRLPPGQPVTRSALEQTLKDIVALTALRFEVVSTPAQLAAGGPLEIQVIPCAMGERLDRGHPSPAHRDHR